MLMSNNINILKATKENLDDVYTLLCTLVDTVLDKEMFAKVYLSNLTNPCIHYYVAALDSKIVGFFSLHIQFLLHHVNKIAEIQELVIDENNRSSGIGRILFQKAKDIAISEECDLIELCSNQRRTRAHEFYIKQGMKNSHYKFTLPLI